MHHAEQLLERGDELGSGKRMRGGHTGWSGNAKAAAAWPGG